MTSRLQQKTPPAFADRSLPLAVVVTRDSWTDPPRMRHEVANQLTRFCNVVFIEHFPAGRCESTAGQWRKAGERLLVHTPSAEYRVPPRSMANNPIVHKRTQMQYAQLIQAAVHELPGHPRILFNFVYNFHEIMQLPEFDWRCYVCFDEFPRMRRSNEKPNPLKAWYQGHLFQHYENQVTRRADRCFTPHYSLRYKLLKINSHVDMLFHAHNSCIESLPSSTKHTNGPTKVAFAGYIHYRLLDEWLHAVASQDDMELHLIGPVDRYDLSDLERCQGFRHTPALDEENMLAELQKSDVLVIPLNVELPEVEVITTNSKTFQYISTCRPIVISDFPHYIQMPEGVLYRAKTAEDFVAQIRRAHAEDCPEFRELRAKIAAENTWDKRGDQLFSVIDSDLNGVLSTQFAKHEQQQ